MLPALPASPNETDVIRAPPVDHLREIASRQTRRGNQPKVNQTKAVTDFYQEFTPLRFAAGGDIRRKEGRTIKHNLKRLASPPTRHDYTTSILMGGNHPQNQFRHMNKQYLEGIEAKKEANTNEAKRKKEESLARQEYERDQLRKEHSDVLRRSQTPGSGAERPPSEARDTPSSMKASQRVAQPIKGLPPRPSSEMSGRPPITESSLLASAMAEHVGDRSRPVTRLASSRPNTQMSMRPSTIQSERRSQTPDAGEPKLQHRQPFRVGLSRGASRASNRSDFDFDGGKSYLPAGKFVYVPPREKTWEEQQEMQLQAGADYETPFEGRVETNGLGDHKFVSKELTKFEKRSNSNAKESYIRNHSTLPQSAFTPPKIILMLFRFSNVRNLKCTRSLRRTGYAELHEQFSITARNGVITKAQYFSVMSRYLSAVEQLEAGKILQCFDRTQLGDVDLSMFLIGLQILLNCATPGDTMRYCFTLMDPQSKIPRYITRYEVQTLVSAAVNARRGQVNLGGAADGDAAGASDLGGSSNSISSTAGEGEIDILGKSIQEMLAEAWRYDYMGRMPLNEFLEVLHEKAMRSMTDKQKKKAEAKSEFAFGQVWQGAPVVSAMNRMSSKKMLYASLTPQNNPGDPHSRKQSNTAGSVTPQQGTTARSTVDSP